MSFDSVTVLATRPVTGLCGLWTDLPVSRICAEALFDRRAIPALPEAPGRALLTVNKTSRLICIALASTTSIALH